MLILVAIIILSNIYIIVCLPVAISECSTPVFFEVNNVPLSDITLLELPIDVLSGERYTTPTDLLYYACLLYSIQFFDTWLERPLNIIYGIVTKLLF